jgi:hypothetical protein
MYLILLVLRPCPSILENLPAEVGGAGALRLPVLTRELGCRFLWVISCLANSSPAQTKDAIPGDASRSDVRPYPLNHAFTV